MRYPRNIRREPEHYRKRHLRFHVVINTHPEVGHLRPEIAKVIWQTVMDERRLDRIDLYAACLMPDHLHLMAAPGGWDIVKFVNAWKSFATHRAQQAGHHGTVWQPGFWDRTMRDAADFDQTIDYIARNPVEARLAERPSDYTRFWAYYLGEPEPAGYPSWGNA